MAKLPRVALWLLVLGGAVLLVGWLEEQLVGKAKGKTRTYLGL